MLKFANQNNANIIHQSYQAINKLSLLNSSKPLGRLAFGYSQ